METPHDSEARCAHYRRRWRNRPRPHRTPVGERRPRGHHAGREPARACAGQARAARVRRVDSRPCAPRAHHVRIRDRRGVPPGGAAVHALGVHAAHRTPGERGRARSDLLEFAQREAESHGRPVVFLYPSSIAAYGLPSLDEKRRAGRIAEDAYNTPSTMYGCNKLYCEQLGRYYARFYKQLSAAPQAGKVDFRCVRFPGPDLGRHRAVRRDLGLRAGDDPCGGQGRTLRVLRAARHADPVHGHARRRRGAAPPGGRAARAPDPDGVQPLGVQPVRRRGAHRGVARVPGRRRSAGRPTRSVRASSTRGRRTWTTARRAATGASRRPTTSRARSRNT